MAGTTVIALLVYSCLFFTVTVAQDTVATCGECDKSQCPSISECVSGVGGQDVCGCCDVCARELGELCDLEGEDGREDGREGGAVYGKCGEYLRCTPRKDLKDSKEATCECQEEGDVCGTDKVTYPSLCHLLAQAHASDDLLNLAVRGPCLAAPVIRSRPEDKERPLGSILVLDCEASGHPVPTITWKLSKDDGTSTQLPGDDPGFAVQVRGGPESGMVTGWVQIMKVKKNNLGVYSCVAENTEGVAEASATVVEMEDSKDHENEI